MQNIGYTYFIFKASILRRMWHILLRLYFFTVRLLHYVPTAFINSTGFFIKTTLNPGSHNSLFGAHCVKKTPHKLPATRSSREEAMSSIDSFSHAVSIMAYFQNIQLQGGFSA